ncbi:polysaccharide biosynthesis protein [Lactiplantibacillus modestisalitolerans]|uniref:Polysaccharide biosynthesis protein n=1 Tax=Lactiplantibacillus modestisalitolerans TaxID=1457219 RepID=A0ABV5WV01_9LACO|nr:polysaccharide biosynthesis protein [Lactiplantibacillus modestisalitolerans]
MKKWLICGAVALLGVVGYSLYAASIQRGQDTVVTVRQRDQNGTPINSPDPLQIVSKAGHRNLFDPTITGYELTTPNPMKRLLPRHNQTVTLRYRSTWSKAQVRHALAHARYLQAGTQVTATPFFNDTQVQKQHAGYGRISTSQDGLTWSKLPISYPNVALTAPSVAYHHGQLTLYDGQTQYVTSDFVHWRKHPLKWTNAPFKRGQIVTPYQQTDGRLALIVKTPQYRYYVGELRGHQVKTWTALRLPQSRRDPVIGVSAVDGHVMAVQQRQHHVSLYRASDPTARFHLVGHVSVQRSRHEQLSNAGVLALKHDRYRLVFNLKHSSGTQAGTFYRELTGAFSATGSQKRLVPDYVWRTFQLSDGQRE